MNHDSSSEFEDPAEPSDARLSALYRLHAAEAMQPSAASDARILAVARAAVAGEALAAGAVAQGEALTRGGAMLRERVARPAAKPAASGWRSWLNASWFGPGLAFATVASLSVVIFSLMPKEDMSIERAVNTAPGAPPPAASAAPAVSAAPASIARKPAPVTAQASPAAPSAESAGALSAPGGSSAKRATDAPASAKLPRSNETAQVLAERSVTAARPNDVRTAPAAPATVAAGSVSMPATTPAASPPPAAMLGKAITQRVETMPRAAPAVAEPDPFPAQSAAARSERADQAVGAPATAPPASTPPAANTVNAPAPRTGSAAPAAPAGGAGTTAPADAGATDNLSPRPGKVSLLSEPTESRMNANQPVAEVRDSAPTYPNEARPSIPLPYTYMTPRAARDSAPGSMAAASGSLSGRGASPQLAAAPPVREPAEWIKAIQKLRIEGKTEQVTKELAEFRRQYPSYVLPVELKLIK